MSGCRSDVVNWPCVTCWRAFSLFDHFCTCWAVGSFFIIRWILSLLMFNSRKFQACSVELGLLFHKMQNVTLRCVPFGMSFVRH